MKTFRGLAAGLALCMAPALAPTAAVAATAQEQLRAFVSTVTAATGTFSQYTVSTQGRTQPAQTGCFRSSGRASSSGRCRSPMSNW